MCSHGASASTLPIDFEWVTSSVAEKNCGSVGGASLALLAAEVENFSTSAASNASEAPQTEASANQDRSMQIQ